MLSFNLNNKDLTVLKQSFISIDNGIIATFSNLIVDNCLFGQFGLLESKTQLSLNIIDSKITKNY